MQYQKVQSATLRTENLVEEKRRTLPITHVMFAEGDKRAKSERGDLRERRAALRHNKRYR